jgi:putative Mn2+ efflux pump MntP
LQFSSSEKVASVAQSVEQRTENPRVVGSIPTGGTKKTPVFGQAFSFSPRGSCRPLGRQRTGGLPDGFVDKRGLVCYLWQKDVWLRFPPSGGAAPQKGWEIKMGILEILILAVGLSMDAFAVSICKGLAMDRVTLERAGVVGLYFGIFQAGMPLLGYLIGMQFQSIIVSVDHWIAFLLLLFLGGKMIYESRKNKEEPNGEACRSDAALGPKEMLPLAVATSIDALAVGVSLAFLQANVVRAVTFIGVVTLVLSMLGVKLGHMFGAKFQSKAEILGGVILILIGTKILLEHLGLLP